MARTLHGFASAVENLTSNTGRKKIQEIAAAAPAAIRVFEEFAIDFAFGGGRSLDDACDAAGVSRDAIMDKLEAALLEPISPDAPELKNPSGLIDHLVNRHHEPTRAEVARLAGLAAAAGAEARSYSTFDDVTEAFTILGNDLISHMRKEEMVLFPYIERLEAALEEGSRPPYTPFGTVNNPVRMMCQEHEETGNILRKLRRLTDDYTIPAAAGPGLSEFLTGLKALEADLYQHIHLENNVLFRQAVEMEGRLAAK